MNGGWLVRLSKLRVRNRRNILIGVSTVSVISVTAGYYFYKSPNFRGTYPREVVKDLKQAIWNESNKGKFNYKDAMKSYIETLKRYEASTNVNKLDDEYTKIELKIAEMYEKSGMLEEANNVYLEILYRFFNALNTPGKVEEEQRPELIRKDLRILIKSLELNKDVAVGKRNLLAHLLLAQEEILTKSPELKKFFDEKKERATKLNNGKSMELSEFKTYVNEDTIKTNEDGFLILDLTKNSSAWETFKEELFIARDLYTAYCLSSKDVASALSCKMTTVEWMVMADMPPGQILLAQANLGSILYLQAEKLDSDIHLINQRTQADPSLAEDEKVIKALRFLHKNRDNCLKMSDRCYSGIIDFARRNNKLRYHAKDQLDMSILQAIALSTYGKGILNLREGVLGKAERSLYEAVRLAREADFSELLKEAESELDKTMKLKHKHSEESKQII